MNERKFINEAVKKLLVSEYIRKETENAGFGNMEMKRTPFGTNITLYVNKPGLVIGRHGSKVQAITENLEKKYKIESPQIEVKEIENPDLNPQVVSKKIALSLEKGWAYRKAGNTSLRRIVENGARGVIISISGKISGERGRMQKFMSGSVKYSGEPARAGMERGFSIAKLKLGVIGVKVGILKGQYKLPDDYTVSEELGVVTPKLIQEESKPEKEGAGDRAPKPEGRERPRSPRGRRRTEEKPRTDAEKKPRSRTERKPREKKEKTEEKAQEKPAPAEEQKPAEEKPAAKPAPEVKEPEAEPKVEPKAEPEVKKEETKVPEATEPAEEKTPQPKPEAESEEKKEEVNDSGAESKTTEGNE